MQIILNDEQKIELPEGSCARDLAQKLNQNAPNQALAAKINGRCRDLSTILKNGDRVNLISFTEKEGKEIFWHTSAHLLAQAVLRLWPNAKPTIGPAIENGFYYDFADLEISDNDFGRLEKEMKKIITENHKPKRELFTTKEEALRCFEHNKYKVEMIQEFPDGEEISAYRQGEFFDLCRGPHLYSLGKIKALKVLKTSGAYWRGDSKNKMLTRIYAITFPDKQLLKEYLSFVEEAKKRDHRKIGRELDLFSLHEAAAGMPFIHPKGLVIWNALISYLRSCLEKAGYIEIKTPIMLSKELWERSGHWKNYKDMMFTSQIEERDFAIKPMNCPGCMLYYKTRSRSYRELPLRISEIGNVHRFEPSGALAGLFRVRSFHQDDAHVIMEEKDIESEVMAILNLADGIYSLFGLKYHLELSTRPEKNTIGTDEEWQAATNGLKNALNAWGHKYIINEGDGAFYGPKIDFHIKDAINRTWQCGTIQLDMALPRKFNLEYTSSDSQRKRPVMLHRTIFGSIERFLGILIEHFAGGFPLWLSPLMVRVVPIADRHNGYADSICEQLKTSGLLADTDKTNESVNKKVRLAQTSKINYILLVGDKEAKNKTINLRTRDNVVHGELEPNNFIKTVKEEKEKRLLVSPYMQQED